MKFLYDDFDNPYARRELDQITVPDFITHNLSHNIRPYQKEAFKRFISKYEDVGFSLHLLYNMATGSGKTLIMAGLILNLYEKGYRNFMFFVSSDNIIRKTKDNFLNEQSSKYLFTPEININDKRVFIKEVENFQYTDPDAINIKFTTIQKLHSDLSNSRENNITFEDFKDEKLVLLADEAHHMNSGTRNQTDLFYSWEGTALKIHEQHPGNILLEFTATIDYDHPEILKKYIDKVIFRYGLAEFRKDKYSKEISLIRSLYDQEQRILQALILNLYRQELANANGIDLKPVILFKAKQKISESEKNMTDFHLLIESLSEKQIDELRSTSTVEIVGKAFAFFDRQNKSLAHIVRRLRSMFKPENCISANNDKEIDETRMSLNTLEEADNHIRAVFAVHKLNEGWDVLNLFDIVRLYEGQNSGGSNRKPGATTLSEAQLIGRGARYFPFTTNSEQDRYMRKFDEDPLNELKVLEELYYHTKEDNRYISELKKVLIESGLYEDEERLVTKQLLIKDEVLKSDQHRNGLIFVNDRIEKDYHSVLSFKDFGVSKVNFAYGLSSGNGSVSGLFQDAEDIPFIYLKQKDFQLSEMPVHVVRYALSENAFFRFDNLTVKLACFPNLTSLSEFITSKDYLGGLSVTFKGTEERLNNLSNKDFMSVTQYLLKDIETEIRRTYTAFENTEYRPKKIAETFTNKEIRVDKDSERADGQELLVQNLSAYAYNANYGTAEEKSLVSWFSRYFEDLKEDFENIRLYRNERFFKIYTPRGNTFEPDFVLFFENRKGEETFYQIFIEPKGKHLIENDKWKEDYLIALREEKKSIVIDSRKYRISALNFYSSGDERDILKTIKEIGSS